MLEGIIISHSARIIHEFSGGVWGTGCVVYSREKTLNISERICDWRTSSPRYGVHISLTPLCLCATCHFVSHRLRSTPWRHFWRPNSPVRSSLSVKECTAPRMKTSNRQSRVYNNCIIQYKRTHACAMSRMNTQQRILWTYIPVKFFFHFIYYFSFKRNFRDHFVFY